MHNAMPRNELQQKYAYGKANKNYTEQVNIPKATIVRN